MIYDGWAALAGNELWNNQRTWAYAMGADLRPCEVALMDRKAVLLNALLGDAPYTDPATDDAPWYDTAYPESALFAGLWVESVVGMDASNTTRAVIDGIGDGGVLGTLRAKPREILVTGWLIGQTCCAVAYGHRWLAAALRSPTACPETCVGDQLCVLRCMPRYDEVGLDACVTSPISDPAIIAEVADEADRYERHLLDVGLVEGPTEIDRVGAGCGCCGCGGLLKVEFRLVAANPWIWTAQTNCLEAEPWDLDYDPDECAIEWTDDPEACAAIECPPEPTCIVAPACETPPEPPEPPVVVTECGCEPLVTSRLCCTIPGQQWFDSVPIIEVYGGTTGVENLTVRVYPAVPGVPDDELSECNPCSVIGISYVAPGATLRIDGATRAITLDCPGAGVVSAESLVFTDGLGYFRWVELGCADAVVCADADAFRTAEDATLTIGYRVREAA